MHNIRLSISILFQFAFPVPKHHGHTSCRDEWRGKSKPIEREATGAYAVSGVYTVQWDTSDQQNPHTANLCLCSKY